MPVLLGASRWHKVKPQFWTQGPNWAPTRQVRHAPSKEAWRGCRKVCTTRLGQPREEAQQGRSPSSGVFGVQAWATGSSRQRTGDKGTKLGKNSPVTGVVPCHYLGPCLGHPEAGLSSVRRVPTVGGSSGSSHECVFSLPFLEPRVTTEWLQREWHRARTATQRGRDARHLPLVHSACFSATAIWGPLTVTVPHSWLQK
jgi:hypothetical protein